MTPPMLSDYVLQHLFTGVQFYTIKAHSHEITRANINLARNHCPSRFIPAEDAEGTILAQGA